ncbi:Putative O-antigen transporter [Listeria fleischmannii subsp. fleischmannii]|uniref:O-antigen transporter n=2 Tax=Listeria fleischmannii TaxID=1069827 RepID=A0A2X3GQE5_9LIST|nr:Putative O-antigen transporter [Listeria fleischmannii subsp. fleischmannii]
MTINYIFVLLYQILLVITPIFTMPYVIRALQPENIGIEAYVSSVVQLFIAFASLGIGDYGRKVIAGTENEKLLKLEFFSLYSVQLIFSTIVLTAYLIFSILSDSYSSLFLINSLTILAYVLDITWFYTGQENIKNIMIKNMIVRIISIFGIFILIKNPDDLALYIFINSFALLLGQLVTWAPVLKRFKTISFSKRLAMGHILPVLTFAIVPIITLIPTALNKVILGNVSSEMEVGYFNQAFKLITLFVVFVTALSSVMSPKMVKQFKNKRKETFEKSIYFSIQYVSFSTLPIVTGLIAIAPIFIPWFLGQQFQPTVINLQILAPSLFFSGISGVFGIQVLMTSGKNRVYALSALFAAIFSFGMNVIFIPYLKSGATSIAYLTFTFVMCLILGYFSRSFFNFKKLLRGVFPYAVASIVAFAGEMFMLYVMRDSLLTMAIQIVLGGIIYTTILIWSKDVLVFKIMNTIASKLRFKLIKKKN